MKKPVKTQALASALAVHDQPKRLAILWLEAQNDETISKYVTWLQREARDENTPQEIRVAFGLALLGLADLARSMAAPQPPPA